MESSKHPPTRKIPVPPNYRNAARILRQVIEEKKSLKSLLEAEKHFRAGRSIMNRILDNLSQINAILEHMNLAATHPRMNVWLARVLIAELLFGRGELVGSSLPVECIRSCDQKIREAYQATKSSVPAVTIFKEPRFVRVNTAVLNMEEAKQLLKEEGWTLFDVVFVSYQAFLDRVSTLSDYEYIVDFHFNDLLVFPNSSKGYWARAEHLRSKFFLQNKACLVATYLLKPPKKSVVLDMCAAPGLKTTHLANLMKNKGRIYAVERNDDRYKVLCQYAAPFGVIKTIHGDCLDIIDEQVPGVEYVLLDPSCSGSGMLDRLRMKETVDESRLYKLAGLQYKLLSHAMNAFPNVRRIVYSTCSIHVEENENVVMGVLRHNGHFKLLDARTELGMEWLHVGSSAYEGIGEHCLYARSEVDLTIGMFVAVFSRCAEGEQNDLYMAHEQQKHSFDRLVTMVQSIRNAEKDRDESRKMDVNNADNNGNTILPSQNRVRHNAHNPFENITARISDLHEQSPMQANENLVIDAEVVNKKKDKRKKRKSDFQNDIIDHNNDTIGTTVAVEEEKNVKSNSEMASELVREKVKRKKGKQQIEDQILDQPDRMVQVESNIKMNNNVENLSEIVDKKVKRKIRKHQAEDNILDQADETAELGTNLKMENNIQNLSEIVDKKVKRKKRKHQTEDNILDQADETAELGTNLKMENNIENLSEIVDKKVKRKKRKHQAEDNILDQADETAELGTNLKMENNVENLSEIVDKEVKRKKRKQQAEDNILDQADETAELGTNLKMENNVENLSEIVDKKVKRKKRKHQAEDNILDLADGTVEVKEDKNNIENVPESVDMVKEKRKKQKKKDKENSGLEQTETTIEVETNTKLEKHIVVASEMVDKKEKRKKMKAKV